MSTVSDGAKITKNATTAPDGRPQDFFPGVNKLGGPETKVPQWGPGMETRWGLRAKSPKSLRQIVKVMHKLLVFWVFYCNH